MQYAHHRLDQILDGATGEVKTVRTALPEPERPKIVITGSAPAMSINLRGEANKPSDSMAAYERATKWQIVEVAVAPGRRVIIGDRVFEEGDEIRLGQDVNALYLQEAGAFDGMCPAVIVISEREAAENRRRRLLDDAGEPLGWTHRRASSTLENPVYARAEDYDQPGKPEEVTPAQTMEIDLGELFPTKPGRRGYKVIATKPERRTPAVEAVDGRKRVKELEKAGQLIPIAQWEIERDRAELEARRKRIEAARNATAKAAERAANKKAKREEMAAQMRDLVASKKEGAQ